MMAKVLIAFLAGFAIAVPSTFWLLKKVRIKSKVRHVQVSLALGMPTALFIYLLQTRFALPVVVITVVLSLLVVALELTLRRIVASLPSTSARTFGTHRTGASVPLDEARIASGSYPFDYLTEDFMTEIHQSFGKNRQSHLDAYIKTHGRVPSEKWFLAYQNFDYHGVQINVSDGIRLTTDTPRSTSVSQNMYLFGGSTMFCIEVPDRLTVSSFLQRLLRQTSDSVQVVNCGSPGATAVDRSRMLAEIIQIEQGDIAVFYFGDNDSGWIDHRSGKLSQQLVPLFMRTLRGLADLGSEIARWIYGEIAPGRFRKFSQSAVSDTIQSLNEAHKHCLVKGAQMLAILQPNIYTLRTKSDYEIQLEKRFSKDLKTLIIDSYQQYENWIKTTSYGVSATHIFNNAPSSIFLDWAHANARGSELIAKFIFEELKNRKLISGTRKV
jgi:lysophospholipase L1-like esterase